MQLLDGLTDIDKSGSTVALVLFMVGSAAISGMSDFVIELYQSFESILKSPLIGDVAGFNGGLALVAISFAIVYFVATKDPMEPDEDAFFLLAGVGGHSLVAMVPALSSAVSGSIWLAAGVYGIGTLLFLAVVQGY